MPESLSSEQLSLLHSAQVYSHSHLPVAAAYCRTLGVSEIVNAAVGGRMKVRPGTIVTAMVLDTLTGRNPLYRLEEFMRGEDIELLTGEPHSSDAFSDTNVARAMDAVFEVGASNILTEIGISAVRNFGVDISSVSYDTTSTSVWGDYRHCEEEVPPPGPILCHGHSKDRHPELKQFMTELLCVDRGVPIFGRTLDGNSSDKKSNNRILTNISGIMARHGLGPGAYVYVADSAMVTEYNLEAITDNLFISRLPATYSECGRAIADAVDRGHWVELGELAENRGSFARPNASYKAIEDKVTLYGKTYRAVVIHSDSHDRRRQKKLKKAIAASDKELRKKIGKMRTKYYCQKDADEAAKLLDKLSSRLHTVETSVVLTLKPARGRPSTKGPRKTSEVFTLKPCIKENTVATSRESELAGCFVMVTNVPIYGKGEMDAKGVLITYKGQYGVESNFAFLKDPVIVNDLFLKKPCRIEALGMVLVIALTIWRLMEKSMRTYIKNTGKLLPGWDKHRTDRPTAFMMSTKIINVSVIKVGETRLIPGGLYKEIPPYLEALGVTQNVFTEVNCKCIPIVKGMTKNA